MTSSVALSPVVLYEQYLQRLCPALDPQSLSGLWHDLEGVAWEQPESALDLNNFAVMALIEADQCDDMSLRSMNLELALEALEQGVEQQPGHPLCVAHLAIVRYLIGEHSAAAQISFSHLLQWIQPAFQLSASLPLGLVYLPSDRPRVADHLLPLLQVKDGMAQALCLLSEGLWRSQQVFYSSNGLRFLQLAVTLMPRSASLRLKLGLAKLMNHQWEGLVDLQQAHQMSPGAPFTLQALYLAYREFHQVVAESWLHTAKHYAQQAPDAPEWQWTTLETNSSFTYVPTPDGILLTVDPSFHSIVTSVLLAEGDWFETEMEFWRAQIRPGMTVIDVGANVGVYTFSAARQVGASGRVLTIEPFSSCVRCLQETCRIHQLDWVTVCAGAASDRPGTARLSLHSSSELNEVVREDSYPDENHAPSGASGSFEDIACFTLDDLIEQENLQRVDWLKIDAEGHEMQVLAGSDRLLTHFAPAILYENIAGASGSNTPVAELLQARGYSLFRYQPYLQTLIPIQTLEQLQGNLNIIALPLDHPLMPCR